MKLTREAHDWLEAEAVRLGLAGKGAVIWSLIVDAMSAEKEGKMSRNDQSQHYDRVVELMTRAGQEVRSTPFLPTTKERLLRARLIMEEALETVEALGVEVFIEGTIEPGDISVNVETISFALHGEPNLVEIADGCADLIVVTTGTLVSCGIPDLPLLELVDENNLQKFGPGGHRDEHGKWIKPPGHKPPDVEGFLHSLRERTQPT